MITALDRVLAGSGQPGLAELRGALARVLGDAVRSARLVGEEKLETRVFRLRFEVRGLPYSVVVKRMEPEQARRNELAIRRWLPAAGLQGMTPALLDVAAESTGASIWHVYEDLGPWSLDAQQPDRERVAAAARLIATLHARFVGHPMLAECRLHGQSFGLSFYAGNVRDATHALEALRPPHVELSKAQAALRDRLLERLRRLRADEPRRAVALEHDGGPETLLHGDLWASNAVVEPAADGPRARLIDWDNAGVGPASYDLSTFLLRFAPAHRPWILEHYREALGRDGWQLPGTSQLNLLFDTAECARYVNHLIWPSIALRWEKAPWALDELKAVEEWFEALGPVLPETPATPSPADRPSPARAVRGAVTHIAPPSGHGAAGDEAGGGQG